MSHDGALLCAFLEGSIDGRNFHHADHVRVGFELLSTRTFCEALAEFSAALKRIAAGAGNPGAYHETMTVAFLSLIAERRFDARLIDARRSGGEHADFEAFAAANPDLLDKTVLTRWYSPDRLASAAARQTFILPKAAR